MPPSRALNNGSSNSGPSALSHHPPNGNPYDDTDELDLLGDDPQNDHENDTAGILGDDPFEGHGQPSFSSPLSFKRKKKQSGFFSQPARLITALTGGAINPSSSFQTSQPPNNGLQPQSPPLGLGQNTRLDPLGPDTPAASSKADTPAFPLDWYAEGPGRRVGYEDLTAIDWIFEYTKERQRQRMLHSSSVSSIPILGHIQRFVDASQVWVVLILTGLAAGALAAAIDITSDWLGDIKYGFCSGIDGGKFYLSKTACCFGYDESSQCRGWQAWGSALGATPGGGVWFVEYGAYLVLAVGEPARVGKGRGGLADVGRRLRLRFQRACWSRSTRYTPSTAGFRKSRRCWAGSSSGAFSESGR